MPYGVLLITTGQHPSIFDASFKPNNQRVETWGYKNDKPMGTYK